MEPATPAPPAEDALAMNVLIRRLVVGFVLLLAGVLLVYSLASEPLAVVSRAFVDRFGLLGVFVGCMLIDATPGLTHEPVLLFALEGGHGCFVPCLLYTSDAADE